MEILIKSLTDTKQFAQHLSSIVEPGLTILLNGPLAVGKTTFVKAFVEALGYEGTVTSPTYTLTNIYHCEQYNVLHSDFYRLKSYHEVEGLGLDVYQHNSINIVEWGDLFSDVFSHYIQITMRFSEHSDESRVYQIDLDHLDQDLQAIAIKTLAANNM